MRGETIVTVNLLGNTGSGLGKEREEVSTHDTAETQIRGSLESAVERNRSDLRMLIASGSVTK